MLLCQGHSGPITGLAVQQLSGGGLLLASTAADEAVRVWHWMPVDAPEVQAADSLFAQDSWKLQQSIPYGVQMQHSAAMTNIPSHADWCAHEHPE
jgi:hypothetical protein